MDKATVRELNDYKAPFLIDKLVKDNIAADPAEAEDLFLEVKRWLILIHSDFSKNWQMYSLRVDEVWHQFVLYSGEYSRFCNRFFGGFVAHSPANAPGTEEKDTKEKGTFKEFQVCYEKMFNMALPDAWFDERNVTLNRRVINYYVNKLELREENGMIDLLGKKGNLVLSVSDIAKEAISYILRSPAFYVREVPGGLTAEEIIGLVQIFVEYNLLRIAS